MINPRSSDPDIEVASVFQSGGNVSIYLDLDGSDSPVAPVPKASSTSYVTVTRDLEDVVERFCERRLGLSMAGEHNNQGGCSKVYSMYDPAARKMYVVKASVRGDPDLIIEEGKAQFDISKQTSVAPKVHYLGSVTVTDGNSVRYRTYDSSGNIESEDMINPGTKIPITVMEYASGKELSDWLDNPVEENGAVIKKGRNLLERLEAFQRIVRAVQSIHEAGYVHRDLKPENVIVLPDGSVKVLDYGLAGMIGAQKVANGATPLYASPEHLQVKIDPRMDVWSLGCMLYEVLTGKSPQADKVEEIFHSTTGSKGKNIAQELLKSMMDNPEHNIEMSPGERQKLERVPEDLNEIHANCRRFDPEQRYQSCAALANALESVLEEMRFFNGMLDALDNSGPASSFGIGDQGTRDITDEEAAFFDLVAVTMRQADNYGVAKSPLEKVLRSKLEDSASSFLEELTAQPVEPRMPSTPSGVVIHKIINVSGDGSREARRRVEFVDDTLIPVVADEIITDGERVSMFTPQSVVEGYEIQATAEARERQMTIELSDDEIEYEDVPAAEEERVIIVPPAQSLAEHSARKANGSKPAQQAAPLELDFDDLEDTLRRPR